LIPNQRQLRLSLLYFASNQCVSNFNAGRAFYVPAVPARFGEFVARLMGLKGSQTAMLDVAMIALGVGFFAASILYVLACERM
jgi:hypothetical protein